MPIRIVSCSPSRTNCVEIFKKNHTSHHKTSGSTTHALVHPDRDGKTPLFYASRSGHPVQMSFLLSVFFVSRVEMSPETVKLALPFNQWVNVIGRYKFKKRDFKMCIAAVGNQAMFDVMTNEMQTIEGMKE